MLKKLAIGAGLVHLGYCLNYIDYFVECAKFGWNEPDVSLKHPWLTADNIYNRKYKS